MFSFLISKNLHCYSCCPSNLVNVLVLTQSCFNHACNVQRGSNNQVEMELRKSIKQLLREASTLSQYVISLPRFKVKSA